jgi:hypothetical protein
MKTQTQINWKASPQNDWTGIELIDTETGETHATIDGCTPEALELIANAPELLAMLKELQANHAWVDRGKLIAKAEGGEA